MMEAKLSCTVSTAPFVETNLANLPAFARSLDAIGHVETRGERAGNVGLAVVGISVHDGDQLFALAKKRAFASQT